MTNFFERFDRFFETSTTGTVTETGERSQRLARRWEAIVGRNAAAFKDAKVLDLASHDGRWSMAALDAGALHVTGIEGRQERVDAAMAAFAHYGVARHRYSFSCGDVVSVVRTLEPGLFDLILNLGFFYHTARHYDIFEQMYRLQPRTIILDTEVERGRGPIIRYGTEGHDYQGHTIPSTPGLPLSIVGAPNHHFIALMCDFFGFDLVRISWQGMGISDWNNIEDYRSGKRRTYVLKPRRGRLSDRT